MGTDMDIEDSENKTVGGGSPTTKNRNKNSKFSKFRRHSHKNSLETRYLERDKNGFKRGDSNLDDNTESNYDIRQGLNITTTNNHD